LHLAAHLLKRLFQNEEKNESAEILQELIIVENQKVLSMEEELDLILKQAEDPPKESGWASLQNFKFGFGES
jgi:hypothetical protein